MLPPRLRLAGRDGDKAVRRAHPAAGTAADATKQLPDEEKERLREQRIRQLLRLRAETYRDMQRLPKGCIPIATDGGYTAANNDPKRGQLTPVDIAGWGVSVRKSVAEYEVETACACGAVFTGETAADRQLPGFVGALEVNAHVAELNGLAQALMYIITNPGCYAILCDCLNALRNIQSQATVDKNIAITEVCRDLLARAREQSTVKFIKVKGHLHEELAKVGVTDADLAPGETYKDLGNVRADELATRAMWSGEHSGFSLR